MMHRLAASSGSLLSAAAGVAAGVAVTRWLDSDASKVHASATPLSGTYELTGVWHGTENAAVESAASRADALQDKTRQCMPRRMSGLLVYQDDGRMWTQCSVSHDESAPPTFTGYAGRWWLHDPRSFSPPHGESHQVEHFVKSASDPSLVGKTVMQQIALSQDGNQLTTTDVKILFGDRVVTEQLQWQRVQ